MDQLNNQLVQISFQGTDAAALPGIIDFKADPPQLGPGDIVYAHHDASPPDDHGVVHYPQGWYRATVVEAAA